MNFYTRRKMCVIGNHIILVGYFFFSSNCNWHAIRHKVDIGVYVVVAVVARCVVYHGIENEKQTNGKIYKIEMKKW